MQASADEHSDIVVEHKCLSTIEASHKSAVAAPQWLPGWEVTSRGALLTGEEVREGCHFIASCAADGRVFFWDCRVDNTRSKRRKNEGVYARPVPQTMCLFLQPLSASNIAASALWWYFFSDTFFARRG